MWYNPLIRSPWILSFQPIPNSPSTYVKIPKIQIYLISLTRSSVYHVKEEETWIKLTTFNLFSKSHVFILTMSSQLMLKKPITSYQFIGCKLCLLCIFETRTSICSLIVSQSACSDITHLDFSRITDYALVTSPESAPSVLWHDSDRHMKLVKPVTEPLFRIGIHLQ